MPTLLLSARQTDDAQKLWRACIDEKWELVRIHGWRAPRFPVPLLSPVPTSFIFLPSIFLPSFRPCVPCVLSRLHPSIALDVGIIQNRGWAVIECNAAFSSGIYGCDPIEVLRVLRRACGTTIS